MTDVEQRARALARRAELLADPQMRVAWVRHELQQLDPDVAAELLGLTAARAEARDAAFATLMLAISVALADPGTGDLRVALVRASRRRGDVDLARRLERPEDDEVEPAAVRVPDFGVGRPLTLGERKSLARTHDRDLIARVLSDPHPDVIAILLKNPSLVERDVVRLCARRPIAPSVVRAVVVEARWMVRYDVRRAIVQNPWSPLDVALQLATHLNAQDARSVARAADLPDELRALCRRLSRDEAALH